jgi:hypothetical protein
MTRNQRQNRRRNQRRRLAIVSAVDEHRAAAGLPALRRGQRRFIAAHFYVQRLAMTDRRYAAMVLGVLADAPLGRSRRLAYGGLSDNPRRGGRDSAGRPGAAARSVAV